MIWDLAGQETAEDRQRSTGGRCFGARSSGALLVLTDDDCTTMREAFGRCSALLHSQPGEINPRIPALSIIQTEIETLERWIANIRVRQEKVA